MLDQAIASVVVEEATPLALVHKPAFKECINMAIKFGVEVGADVYLHMDRRKLRNRVIPQVIKEQDLELLSFDKKIAKFGATLVSDGKVSPSPSMSCSMSPSILPSISTSRMSPWMSPSISPSISPSMSPSSSM